MPAAIIIGICGGTGCGKTTLCKRIARRIGPKASIISHDMYYMDLSHMATEQRDRQNFDHPDAFDNELFFAHLSLLKQGKGIGIPEYDYVSHTRSGKCVLLENPDTVLIDGIMLFDDQRIRNLFDYKVFVKVDSDIRFIRRLQRDLSERGRTLESVISQWLSSVKPMHDTYVEPSKAYADLIVSGNDLDEMVTIDQLADLAMEIREKKLTKRHVEVPPGVRGRNFG